MKISLLNTIGCATLAVLLFAGCGAKKVKDAENIEVTKEEAFQSVTSYPIPTSFELIQLISKAGASYIISICNPVENMNKYLTEKEKCINLGIYGADLAYATTYQMTQEIMSYLDVTKKLVENLNISIGFNKQLAERVEKNIGNKDSLIMIITNSYYDTYKYLVQNGKDNQSLIVIAGSWIEGLYITSQIAMTSRDNKDFVAIMADQKTALSTIMELLKARSGDADVDSVIALLKPIVEVYDKVEGNTLTAAQLEKITNVITEIRTSVI